VAVVALANGPLQREKRARSRLVLADIAPALSAFATGRNKQLEEILPKANAG
jgi:hypothetical protein